MYHILFTLELVQILSEPTRVQRTSNSLLDLVFGSNHFRTDDCKVEVSQGISDHEMVLSTLYCMLYSCEEIIHMNRKIKRLRKRNRQRTYLELKVNISLLTKQLKKKVLEARK